MTSKAGIEERYPLQREWVKALMFVYAFATVVSLTAEQWNTWWFWPLVIFGGIPWVGATTSSLRIEAAREGYNAAMDDALMAVSALCTEMHLNGPMSAHDFDMRTGEALLRLRPFSSRDMKP